jgi:hypothetical protein
MLARSPLALAGLIVGVLVIWLVIQPTLPLWWSVGWKLGFGQLVLGMTVLAAAQLAAGRARRNAMNDLYTSFPVTAGTRTVAHLAGVAGALPGSLLLIAAGAAGAELRGAIGSPSIAVLAGGLLLVSAAGAAGVALGVRFPHPLAGMLGALVLFLSSGQSHLPWAAGVWLYPWASFSGQLGILPAPVAGYPPGSAHALELAGLAVLAGIMALALAVPRSRARRWLGAAGVASVAAICFAGALQLEPIPTADLNHLVTEVTDPASVQHCAAVSRVRYCLYTGFGSLLPSLESPVGNVLALLPVRPAQPLVIRQVVMLSLPDSTLTHGHTDREVAQWDAQVQRAPGNATAAPASEIYLPVGNWPAGSQLADARFDLALAAAQWAVHLVGNGGVSDTGSLEPCVPFDQAREAIAIWLAIRAAQPSAGELQHGLGTGVNSIPVAGASTVVRTWNYPGQTLGSVVPPGGITQDTATGYLLASAMTSLPARKVSRVLADTWGTWVNWHTTDAQLAAALGIPAPGAIAAAASQPGTTIVPGSGSPVCTS